MDINFEKGIVTLYDKNIKLEPLIKRLSLLSGEQVYHFLSNRGIQIPRAFNCYALISVLNQRIKYLDSKSLSKDYFQRLQYYKYFTEQQLFNLFRKICNDEQSFYEYRYNFFKLLFVNFVSMNLNDGEITYLKNLKKGKLESFEEYFNYISSCSLEQEGSFDGRNIEELKTILPLSASNQDVFDLAGKYGIELPTRLKKKQFLDFIVYYMKKNNDYNDAIGEELEVMTVAQLTTYARRTGIPMQANMNKNDLITYLFYYLEQCEIDYTSIKRVELLDEYEPLSFTIDFSLINNFQSDEAVRVIHYAGEDLEDEDDEEVNEMIDEDINDEEIDDLPSREDIISPVVGVAASKEMVDSLDDKEVEEATIDDEKSDLNSEEEALEDSSVEEDIEETPIAMDDTPIEPIDDACSSNEEVNEEINEEVNEEVNEAPEENSASLEENASDDLEASDFEVQYVADDYAQDFDDIDDEPVDEEPVAKEPVEENGEITDEEIQALIDEHNEQKDNSNPHEDKAVELSLDVEANDNYGNKKLIKLAKGKGKAWAITISILIVLALLGAVAYLYFFKK